MTKLISHSVPPSELITNRHRARAILAHFVHSQAHEHGPTPTPSAIILLLIQLMKSK